MRQIQQIISLATFYLPYKKVSNLADSTLKLPEFRKVDHKMPKNKEKMTRVGNKVSGIEKLTVKL